jgi:hypothetical protein
MRKIQLWKYERDSSRRPPIRARSREGVAHDLLGTLWGIQAERLWRYTVSTTLPPAVPASSKVQFNVGL